MEDVMKVIGLVVVLVGGIVFLSLLLCLPLMWTWNYVMPYLFGLKTITWTQAWSLSFISGVLIKSSTTTK